SLECLAAPPKGAPYAGSLIAVTEHSLDADGNHRSFVLRGKQFTRFSVQRSDDFDVSDCAITGADLLLLERRIGPLISAAIRIRKMPLAAIKDGALVDGAVLLQADLGYRSEESR